MVCCMAGGRLLDAARVRVESQLGRRPSRASGYNEELSGAMGREGRRDDERAGRNKEEQFGRHGSFICFGRVGRGSRVPWSVSGWDGMGWGGRGGDGAKELYAAAVRQVRANAEPSSCLPTLSPDRRQQRYAPVGVVDLMLPAAGCCCGAVTVPRTKYFVQTLMLRCVCNRQVVRWVGLILHATTLVCGFSSVRLVGLGEQKQCLCPPSFVLLTTFVLSTRLKRKGKKKGGSPSWSASVWWDMQRNWAVGFSGYRGPFGQVLEWVVQYFAIRHASEHDQA